MDTEKLRYFCLVVKTGSLTAASEIAGISHSGISKALTLLQKEVRLQLLKPRGRGIEVTDPGRLFYRKAARILELLDDLSRADHAPPPQALRLGLPELLTVTSSHLLAREFAGRALVLVQIEVGGVERGILDGELDFGFAFVPKPHPDFEYLKIGDVSFGPYAREDLAKNDGEELAFAVPLADFPANAKGYRTRDGWPEVLKRNATYAVSNFATGLDLLRNGQCVSQLPDFVASQENSRCLKVSGKRIVPVDAYRSARSKRALYLVKTARTEETAEMRRAAKVVRGLCLLRGSRGRTSS